MLVLQSKISQHCVDPRGANDPPAGSAAVRAHLSFVSNARFWV